MKLLVQNLKFLHDHVQWNHEMKSPSTVILTVVGLKIKFK